MFAILLTVWTLASQEVLRSERDVPRPERIRYVPAEYPSVLRGAMPVVMGLIFMDVELDEEGRPIDIKVLSGIPLLDREAIAAVRQWRYKPTIVEGSPRRVALIEVVDLFPSEGLRVSYFIKTLNDPKASKTRRLFALRRLEDIGPGKKQIVRALEKASKDSDADIRDSAAELLRAIAVRGESPPPQ